MGKNAVEMKNQGLPPQVSGAGWFGRLGRAGLGLALAAGVSTCGPGHGTDCLKSTGDIISQRRALSPGFITVTAFDNVDVKLVQDSQTYAEVRSGENLIDDITLTQNGNSLSIANTSTCNWARSYDTPREVTLHLPHITNVFLRGQGNVSTIGEFQQDTVFFHLVGAGDYDLQVRAKILFLDQYEMGDLTVRGTAEVMRFDLGGSGRLFASGLTAQRCYFKTTRDSYGDAHLRASEQVGGTVAGTGTVYYGGSPRSTDIQVTGRGAARAE